MKLIVLASCAGPISASLFNNLDPGVHLAHLSENLRQARERISKRMTRHSKSSDESEGTSRNELAALEARSRGFLADSSQWGQPAATTKSPAGQIVAWTQKLPKGEPGSGSSVVKARGLVRATPQELFDLVWDSSRVYEYNKYTGGRTDVATLGPKTKVVWNRTRPPGAKPQDFCTVLHGVTQQKDGTLLLLSTATTHPAVAPSAAFARSEVLLGANLMRPVGPKLTEVTTVSHVVTNGIPSFLVERVAASSAADFIKTVDEVLGGKCTASRDEPADGAPLSELNGDVQSRTKSKAPPNVHWHSSRFKINC